MTAHDRERLVARLRREGISDSRVLEAIRIVPRERFIADELAPRAYENEALPIAAGQTISQPYVVAHMTQALALDGSERVLEIGTGTGYQTMILSLLAREVVSVERIESLARAAEARLADLGARNVSIHVGDGTLGYPPSAPYDAILVSAAGPRIPTALAAQLPASPPRRRCMPVRPRHER